MTCNNIILSQPQAGATLNHDIPDDVSARLNFGPDDISGLRLGGNGELIISFAEGGQLNITNFNSVVDNGNLLYLEDGTLIDPSILTSSLRSPQDFNNIETAAGTVSAGEVIASTVELVKPQANTIQNVSIQDGQKYVCNFDPSNANVEVRDGKMYLTFADGSQIVVNNFEKAELPEALLIPEQEILTEYEVIETIEEILAVEPIEEVITAEVVEPKVAVAESVAEQVANIAPAAGEIDSVAQNLANIAPAAGEGASGNSGYGFSSTADSANFDSAFAIGPIGPTALNFVTPNVAPERLPSADVLSPIDRSPIDINGVGQTDDTNLAGNGMDMISGAINVDYQGEGPGTTSGNGSFDSSGNLTGGNLTSNGVPVVVTFDSVTNTYTGVAGGTTVFTMVINSDETYKFTQLGALDHSDTNDNNEALFLDFGVTATDSDGDTGAGTVRITVLDDAPIIGNDEHTVDETNLVNGVVTLNDSVSVDFGEDGRGSVMTTGQFSSTGSQTNGNLSSGGVDIVVTQTANGYVGAAGGVTVFALDIDSVTGNYTFRQYENLDHADGNDDNDVITLNFPIKITDADGDSDSGVIVINVRDDAPEARDDSVTVDDGETVTGNVQNNDSAGQDDTSTTVTQVMFGGVTYAVPANGTVDVPGNFGTLTIAADGSYSYTSTNSDDGGMDQFKYTLRDHDGDTDTAILKITVEDDEVPIDISGVGQTDDTNLADDDMDMVAGEINVNYQGDGPGVTTGNGDFGSAGNRTNNALTSNGVAVAVTFDAATNTYTGVAGGTTVFTMVINSDETFKFTQLAPLDHSDTNDDNEALFLDFGVTATDSDGDTGTGTVRITVLDDGPSVSTRAHQVFEDDIQQGGMITATGTITHDFGEDGAGSIEPNGNVEVKYQTGGAAQTLTSNGVAVVIAQTANGYVGTANGQTVFTFAIDPATGEYTYKQFAAVDHVEGHNPADDVIWLRLGVDVTDFDGDTVPAFVVLDIHDDEPVAVNDKLNLDAGNRAGGNVLTNDDIGADENGSITSVRFEGQDYNVPAGGSVTVEGNHGTLVLNSNGTYTYDANSTPQETVYSFNVSNPENGDSDRGAGTIENVAGSFNPGTNQLDFSFVIDGTQANAFTLVMNGGENPRGNGGEVAILYFDASRGGEPVVTAYAYSGLLQSYIDGDAATFGNQAPDRILSSTDANDAFSHISVTTDGNGNQVFSFSMDATDIIEHNPLYPVAGTDWSGIGFGEELGIWFHPYAGVSTTYDAQGNLTSFDGSGNSSFWDESNVPTTVTRTGGNDAGEDHFTYTMVDGDGDTSTAHLNVCVHEDNDVPTITSNAQRVYENDIQQNGMITFTGAVTHDFGNDGAGRIQSNGIVEVKYEVGGAVQTLTSAGVAVIVTQTANGYVGRAAGETVFTFAINPNTGEYTYKQFTAIDHPEGHDPADDVLWLKLGVDIFDADGDKDSGFVTFDIYDDNPIAVNDKIDTGTSGGRSLGNVLINDDIGADGNGSVTSVRFEGQNYNVPNDGSVTVDGNFGTLVLSSNGTYTYEANTVPQETIYSFHSTTGFGREGAGALQEVSGSYNETTEELNFSFRIDGTKAEGFALVLNDGVNPVGVSGESALIYFDASRAGTPVVSSYVYNGVNGFSSYQNTSTQIVDSNDANNPFSNITTSVDSKGDTIFTLSVDAEGINDYLPQAAWNGVAFTDFAGIWLHSFSGLETSYDANGNLTDWSFDDESWYDTSSTPTDINTIGGGVSGEDRFTYTLTDGDGDTSTASLEVCVCDDGANVIHVNGSGVYSGTAGTDLFILNALQNIAPTLNNFEIGEDRVDLSQLLQNVDDVTAAIEDFVHVTTSANGQDTLISVDADGQGGNAPELAVRLEGTNDNTLDDLIENHTIIV